MSGASLALRGVSIRFGGVTALEDVSFDVRPREIFALIGPNGAGKTTLFNVISGIYRTGTGTVQLDSATITGLSPAQLARLGLTRTFQNLQIFLRMTVAENVMVGCHLHEKRNPLAHILGLPGVHRQNAESRARAEALLAFVDLGGLAGQAAGELSYGALKRLEIARALAARPRLLMLDEPVAGCNAVETAEMAEVIRKVAGAGVTVLLVEHDMKLVMRLADRIHVLDRGRTLAAGTPAEISADRAVIAAYLGTATAEMGHAGG